MLYLERRAPVGREPDQILLMNTVRTGAAIVIALLTHSLTSAQFTGLSSEVVAVDGIPGTFTYRVYAEFGNLADQLVAVYGFDDAPLEITSTEPFYQDALGGPLTTQVNAAAIDLVPSLAFDTWLTIGRENATANTLQQVGFDFTFFEAGGSLVANDPFGGLIFTLPGDAQNFPVDGRVLIAQFTSAGTVNALLNIQWQSATGVTFNEEGIALSLVGGCTDQEAINYDLSATVDDGSCLFAEPSFDGLSWELVGANTIDDFNTYRVYANFTNPDEQLVAVFGVEELPLNISTSGTFYQNPLGGPFSTSITPALIGLDPEVAFDSWVTIGADDATNNNLQEINVPTANFEAGESLSINSLEGGAWFVLPGDQVDAFPDAQGRVLIAQLTTDGIVDLTLNLQYRAADGSNPQELGLTLTFPEFIEGCTDSSACNFDPIATNDDGSCLFFDECGNCGGTATAGCTDFDACNYNPNAACDDGSCEYISCAGCTDLNACNYDPDAILDDGSCDYSTCTCWGDFNGDGERNITDMLILLSNFGCLQDCIADMNGDDIVSTDDLLLFLGVFGQPCE